MRKGSLNDKRQSFYSGQGRPGGKPEGNGRATGVSFMTILQAEQGLIKRPLSYARALQQGS